MSDYIDREQAIDAVKTYWMKVVDDIPKGTGFEEVTQSCDMALEHNANILKAINQLPPAQQWIPCSERLPEDGVEVMTTVEIISNGKRFVEQGSYFYHGWCLIYDNLRLASNIRVIAWMPLPKPYKGGDDDDE